MTEFCANCHISKRIHEFGNIYGRFFTAFPQFLLKTQIPIFRLQLSFLELKQARNIKKIVPLDGIRNKRKDENNNH